METKNIELQWHNFDAVTMLKTVIGNPEYVPDEGFRMGLMTTVSLLQMTLSKDLFDAWNILKVLHAAVSNQDYVPDTLFRVVLHDAILLVEDRIWDELNSN